jgi:hypothetical protein
MLEAVAYATPSPSNNQVAQAVARLPANASDLFASSNPNAAANSNALGDVFANYSNTILQRLTYHDDGTVGVINGEPLKQYMVNTAELGSLLNVVLFNPNVDASGLAKQAILQYAGPLKTQINAPNSSADAIDRMEILRAAMDDSLVQTYNGIYQSQQNTRDTISFIADLVVAGLPAGDLAKDAVSKLVGDAFGSASERVTSALQGVVGDLVDKGTGQLSGQAQDAIAKALGVDSPTAQAVLTQTDTSDALQKSLLSGITNGGIYSQIENESQNLEADIAIIRGQSTAPLQP